MNDRDTGERYPMGPRHTLVRCVACGFDNWHDAAARRRRRRAESRLKRIASIRRKRLFREFIERWL